MQHPPRPHGHADADQAGGSRPARDYAALVRIGLVAASATVLVAHDGMPRAHHGDFVEDWIVRKWGWQVLGLHFLAIPMGVGMFSAVRQLRLRVLVAMAALALAQTRLPGIVLLGVAIACDGGVILVPLAAALS